jgi:hypothetical protein
MLATPLQVSSNEEANTNECDEQLLTPPTTCQIGVAVVNSSAMISNWL